jgi:hypothetical protein
VGIGNTSPSALLEIGTNAALPSASQRLQLTGYKNDTTSANLEIGDGNNVYWRFARDNGNNFQMDLSSYLKILMSGSEKMRIDSSGRVGIGRTSMSYPLEVSGDILCGTSGNTLRFGRSGQSDGARIQCNNSSDLLFSNNGGNERMRIASSGQIGIGGANYGTDGQVLTSTGASTAPAWEDVGGGGKVLQVVSTTSTTRWSSSSTSWTSVSGLNASITPSATSSKILVMASVNVAIASGQDHWIRCIRGASTDVGGGSSGYSFFRHGDGEQVIAKVLVDLDAPANTSSNVYTIQVRGEGNNIYVNQTKWGAQYLSSSITLMEIGA